jgi:hypothetical protein
MYQTFGNMKSSGEGFTSQAPHARNAIRRPKLGGNYTRPSSQKHVEYYNPTKTSISSYNPVEKTVIVNQTKENNSKGKALWGRPLWFSLHYGALYYPDSVDSKMVNMTMGFIRGLPIMIPCDLCKNHAYDYISRYTDAQLRSIAGDKHKLFKFYVDFHNAVNTRTGKSTMSLEDAYSLYSNNPTTAL